MHADKASLYTHTHAHAHAHTPITSSSPSHHRNTDRDVQVYKSIFEDLKRKILTSEMKSLALWEIRFVCLFSFHALRSEESHKPCLNPQIKSSFCFFSVMV